MTIAEQILNTARMVKHPKDKVVEWALIVPNQTVSLSRVALALRFDAMPPVIKFRAIVEEWSQERIVKECY